MRDRAALPTYTKAKPERTLDEIANSAKAIMQKPLAPGSDTRLPAEIKTGHQPPRLWSNSG